MEWFLHWIPVPASTQPTTYSVPQKLLPRPWITQPHPFHFPFNSPNYSHKSKRCLIFLVSATSQEPVPLHPRGVPNTPAPDNMRPRVYPEQPNTTATRPLAAPLLTLRPPYIWGCNKPHRPRAPNPLCCGNQSVPAIHAKFPQQPLPRSSYNHRTSWSCRPSPSMQSCPPNSCTM